MSARPLTRPLAVLVTALALVLGAATLPAQAAEPGFGTVAGTVTDGTDPLADVEVRLYVQGSEPDEPAYDQGLTDADGTFALEVEAGTYRVAFAPVAGDGWAEHVTTVHVTDQGTVRADAVLTAEPPGPGVAGVVTGGGQPLAGIDLALYRNGTLVASAETGADGRYVLPVEADGTYTLVVSDDLSDGWQSVEVPDVAVAGGREVRDVTLTADATAGAVTGRVRDADDVSLAEVDVTVYDASGEVAGTATTDDVGRYEVSLGPGTYRVGFSLSATDPWTAEFHSDKPTIAAADAVVVASSPVTVDAVLAADATTGTLQGVVRQHDGQPAPYVGVQVLEVLEDGQVAVDPVADLATEEDGTFSVTLPAGSYVVRASADGEDWWATTDSPATAVTAGGAASVTIDLSLSPQFGLLTGTVSGPLGAPLGVAVTVYRPGAGGWTLDEDLAAYTDDDGDYALVVPAGAYRVGFSADPDDEWRAEFFDDARTLAAATTLTVGGGATTRTDAVLAPQSIESWDAPQVRGSTRLGGTLTATPGEWSVEGLSYAYQWFRGRTAITGATKAAYKTVAADLGQRLSVRVTASFGGVSASASSSPTSAVTTVSKVTLKAKAGKGRTKGKHVLTFAVTAPGVNAVAGKVVLMDGRKRLGTVTLRKGSGSLTVKLAKGKHTITANYSGTSGVTSGKASVTVKAK